MVQELTLLWLSASSQTPHQAQLDAWSRVQGATLREPPAELRPAYDPAIVEAIELQLDDARTAVAGLQGGTQAVDQACAAIAAHPELPQAAWLTAECHRLRAAVSLQEGNALQAAEHDRAANALEGQRAAVHAPSSSPVLTPLEPTAVVEIEIVGTRSSDEIYLDGQTISLRTLASVGAHHLRVVRSGVALFSGWLNVAEQGGKLVAPLAVTACSASDLQGVQIHGSTPGVPADVRCPRWVIARPLKRGIELWRCHTQKCENGQQWPIADQQRQAQREPAGSTWYVWPLLGAGVALGTAAILWQTGAFDRSEPDQAPGFSFTGTDPASSLIHF